MNTPHFNYLILAHKDPDHLERMIHNLADVNTSFYIHVDLKTDIDLFLPIESRYKNVHFIPKRERCIWGDFSIVQATINLINAVRILDVPGHCLLLSGQDYPIKSKASIHSFLAENIKVDFIDAHPAHEVWPAYWKKRLQYYRYNFSEKQGDYLLIPPISSSFFWVLLPKTLYKIISSGNIFSHTGKIAHLIGRRRSDNTQPTFYGGSQWWTLTNETIRLMKQYILDHPKVAVYHKFTHAADELFFQTVFEALGNSRNHTHKNVTTTFIFWDKNFVSSPKVLKETEETILLQQEEHLLFARKFETGPSTALIAKIDRTNNNI